MTTDQTTSAATRPTHHTYIRDWSGDNENNPVIVVVEIDYNHPEPFEDAFTRVLRAGARHCTDMDGSGFADGEEFGEATVNLLHLCGDASAMLEDEFLWANLTDADGPVWSGHASDTGEWCRWSGKRVTHEDLQDRCPDQHFNAIRLDGPAKPAALLDISRIRDLLIDGQGLEAHAPLSDAQGRTCLVVMNNGVDVVWLTNVPGQPWLLHREGSDGREVTLWASDHDTTNVIAAAVIGEQFRAIVQARNNTRER